MSSEQTIRLHVTEAGDGQVCIVVAVQDSN